MLIDYFIFVQLLAERLFDVIQVVADYLLLQKQFCVALVFHLSFC